MTHQFSTNWRCAPGQGTWAMIHWQRDPPHSPHPYRTWVDGPPPNGRSYAWSIAWYCLSWVAQPCGFPNLTKHDLMNICNWCSALFVKDLLWRKWLWSQTLGCSPHPNGNPCSSMICNNQDPEVTKDLKHLETSTVLISKRIASWLTCYHLLPCWARRFSARCSLLAEGSGTTWSHESAGAMAVATGKAAVCHGENRVLPMRYTGIPIAR